MEACFTKLLKVPMKSHEKLVKSTSRRNIIVYADARMVGRRLEAALSVSGYVKSQSCNLFIRMGKLDAREKKALSSVFLCFA